MPVNTNYFFQNKISSLYIPSCLLPLLFPLIRARNIPMAQNPPQEDFQTSGRALFNLAQQYANGNGGSDITTPEPSLKITSAGQAAMAGLYAAQAFFLPSNTPKPYAPPPASNDLKLDKLMVRDEVNSPVLFYIAPDAWPIKDADSLYYAVNPEEMGQWLPTQTATLLQNNDLKVKPKINTKRGLASHHRPAPALLRSTGALITRCQIKLEANQEGREVKNLNPDAYGRGRVYEVAATDTDYSQPVYQRYVMMDEKKVAVRLNVMPGRGVKYEIFNQRAPKTGYALAFDQGRWQLQSPTTRQITSSVLASITANRADPGCREADLSAPDDRGLQWTSDNKSYLRVRGAYVRVIEDKNYINRYRIPADEDNNAVQLRYYKSRFCLANGRDKLTARQSKLGWRIKYKQRGKIDEIINEASSFIASKNIENSFGKLKKAFNLHRRHEAGSINKLMALARHFLNAFILDDSGDESMMMNKSVMQNQWLKNIQFPLTAGIILKKQTINAFSHDVAEAFFGLSEYAYKPTDKKLLTTFYMALNELSVAPLR